MAQAEEEERGENIQAQVQVARVRKRERKITQGERRRTEGWLDCFYFLSICGIGANT